VQHGKQVLEKERTPLVQIDNTFSPLKKSLMSETSSIISNFDDASCASSSTSENNTNDFVHNSLLAGLLINSSHLSPTSSTALHFQKAVIYERQI